MQGNKRRKKTKTEIIITKEKNRIADTITDLLNGMIIHESKRKEKEKNKNDKRKRKSGKLE